MVHNGNSSDINDVLWDQHFALTIVRHNLRLIEEETLISDRYLGKMFLNFIQGKEVRSYCGVDITNMRSEDNKEWEGIRQSSWDI